MVQRFPKAARRKRGRYACLALGVGFAAIGGSAFAQTELALDAEDGSQVVSETIIVTASRREQALFDTPQSVAVLTGEFLEDYGLQDFSDYAGLVPSLDFVEFAPGQTRITIRGVSGEQGAATISYYIDDVPVTGASQNAQPDVNLFDIERVEILRGPQGTLFGENAMGGAVRVVTRAPEATNFAAGWQTSVGSIEGGGLDQSAQAMVNVPIVSNVLAFRAVGSWRSNEGWIDNTVTGQDDVNSFESFSGRFSLLFTPTPDVSIRAQAILSRLDIDSPNATNSGEDVATFGNSPSQDDYDIYSLTGDFDLGFATLTSVSSWAERDFIRQAVDDPIAVGSINGLLTLFCINADPASFNPMTGSCSVPIPSALLTQSTFFSTGADEAFTQEVRLMSKDEGRLRWIVGGFYREAKAAFAGYRVTDPEIRFANPLFGGFGFATGDLVPGGFLTSNSETEIRNYAVFGEGTYELTDNLELTLGLRAFGEDIENVSSNSGVVVFPSGFTFTPTPLVGDADADGVNMRAILSYEPSESSIVYASYSEGFRSGGPNTVPNTSPLFSASYDPDRTRNYEIGGRVRFEELRLELSGAAYYIDWQDLQILDFDLLTGSGFVRNAGAAHTQGLEIELVARPVGGLMFSVGGSVNESELDQAIPGANFLGAVIPAGRALPNVPEYKYGAAVEYVRPLADGLDGVIRFSVNGVGDSFSALEPRGANNSLQRAYDVGSFRIGVERPDWSMFLFVDNVWDEFAELGDNNFGSFHRNQPRTIGLTLRGEF